ncbi:MAG TPA: class F sortase [Micromonosporaceae bacterium]
MIAPLPAAGPDARRRGRRRCSRRWCSGQPRPTRSGSTRPAWLAVLAGLLALVWALGWYRQAQPAPDVGTDVARALASPATVGLGQPVEVRSGAVPDRRPGLAPIRLRIPSIRVDARVVPIGVDAKTGDLAVPASVDTVGWYALGPDLAAPTGSVVVAGHVDAYDEGAGAFFRLRDLRPGADITVTDATGHDHRYRVVARERYPKTSVPVDRIFTTNGVARLTLITCGGRFDQRTRSYHDNVVVTAVRVG